MGNGTHINVICIVRRNIILNIFLLLFPINYTIKQINCALYFYRLSNNIFGKANSIINRSQAINTKAKIVCLRIKHLLHICTYSYIHHTQEVVDSGQRISRLLQSEKFYCIPRIYI